MKKAICLILALLTACAFSAAFAEGESDVFVSALSETCDVQQGHFEYMDTIALASQGKLISCFGNNAGSGYLVPMIPPAPNQDPAPATEMGQFSWPAEAPSVLYDASAENAQGDNRDTSYLMTDDFTLNSDEDFVVVYGVNHVATGKATYANTVLYARPMLNGIVSLYDSMYADSADAYLDGEDSGSYYVMKLARIFEDAPTASIPYSTDNPNGRFYGADNGAQLFLAYRAYMEPETGVGPSYYEIVYDRAIVFHKK